MDASTNDFKHKPRKFRAGLAVFAVGFAIIGISMLLKSNAATPSLPAGVMLQQIDGGSNYYCSNGFTYACSSTFNGMSWDDPKFFPIGDDYPFYPSNSTATFKALGLNFAHRVTGDTDLTVLKNAGIWAIPATGEGQNPGPETVGWHVEEPGTWSDITGQVTEEPGAALSGRFIQMSSTWNQFVYGGYSSPCGTTMNQSYSCPISTSTGSTVHLNIPGDDIYWFAGSTVTDSYGARYAGSLFYNNGGTGSACGDAGSGVKCMTADQMARGSNFGDMVDQMRTWTSSPAQPAPNCPYIETEDGLVGTGSREITPPELNWAVWNTIVHGARCILYFGTTSNFGSVPTFGFSKTVLSGQSISMYDQATATNTLIKNLAPVINSPFALHYASVSPAAYTFPTAHLALDSGIDIMAKDYSGGNYSNSTGTIGNGFYIFSSVRGSETQTNIHATFTTADNYTGPVTVVGENRTVQATNGVFSDTFAKATDTHIYQIPYNTGGSGGIIGDLNNDGHVNITDLSIFLTNWNTTNAVADLNGDGKVNITDLSMLLSHWG